MSASSSPTELAGVAAFDPIGLDDLVAQADLPRRFDAKYVVPVDRLEDLLASWAPRMRVLEVDGRRATRYGNTYFDTPDLRTYRDHLQRRRRRFKIRTRVYGDARTAMLEVKLKGRDGQTNKQRRPHPHDDRTHLGDEALAFVEETLAEAYAMALPAPLAPVATNSFERTTLVDLPAGERITIDRGLTVESLGRRIELGADHAVVETKSPRWRGAASHELHARGLRPDRVSKYCLGIAASHEEIRGNPWLPALRRMEASVDW